MKVDVNIEIMRSSAKDIRNLSGELTGCYEKVRDISRKLKREVLSDLSSEELDAFHDKIESFYDRVVGIAEVIHEYGSILERCVDDREFANQFKFAIPCRYRESTIEEDMVLYLLESTYENMMKEQLKAEVYERWLNNGGFYPRGWNAFGDLEKKKDVLLTAIKKKEHIKDFFYIRL